MVTSVIVDDADLSCIAALEPEDDPVLVVDPDAEESGVVPLEGLQAVAWWVGEVSWLPRPVEPVQLPLGFGPQLRWQAATRRLGPVAMEDVLGGLVGEVKESWESITLTRIPCKRWGSRQLPSDPDSRGDLSPLGELGPGLLEGRRGCSTPSSSS